MTENTAGHEGTRTGETEELTPGRETDANVARALGYTVYHYDKGYAPYWMLMDPSFETVTGDARLNEADAWLDSPHFSTDEGDAMRALMTFGEWEIWHEDGLYQCLLGGVWYRPACPDLCLAVCGAVLKAAAAKEKQP